MGAVDFSIDTRLVDRLQKALPISVFVESGTYEGEAVDRVRDSFAEIHTIELADRYYRDAAERFAEDAHVRLYHGDSGEVLRSLRGGLAGRNVLYWLDAHWCSSDGTAGEDSQCPLLEELAALEELNSRSVVLIDDARLFLATPPYPHEASEWPRFDEVLERLRALSSTHEIAIVNDMIVYYPEAARAAVSEYARSHGVDVLAEFHHRGALEQERDLLAETAANRLAVIAELERERELVSAAAEERLKLIETLEQRPGLELTDRTRATVGLDDAPAGEATPADAFWPPAEAFWTPGLDDQWSDGRARCTALAVCDAEAAPIRAAHEGQAIHILSEFVADAGEAIAAGWFELYDDAGLLVHGKNSFHDGSAVRLDTGSPLRLRYRYVVHLDVAPGEYVVKVGLSSTHEAAYLGYWRADDSVTQWPVRPGGAERAGRYRQVGLPEEQFEPHVTRHCEAQLPDTIRVGFGADGRRASTGLVGLRGASAVAAQKQADTPTSSAPSTAAPTVVHVTHYKAGSQWIYGILRACVPDRIVSPDARSGHLRYWPPEPGKVYPTVYLTKQQLDTVALPPDCRTFVVVRDLRDTLISSYFSLVKTHGMADRPSLDLRRLLSTMTVEQGLVYLLDHWLEESARIQLSWLEAGEPLIRYEDILERDVEVLEEVLLDRCGLDVPRDEFRRIVAANRFEQATGGRSRGTEDQTSHTRKGIAGDWQNHFTEPVTRAFKARYGGVLVATGYEEDLDW